MIRGGKKQKGKKIALTDFLLDEAGNQQGPGTSYVLANKAPVNDWAAEMESLDIDTDPSYSVPINRSMLPAAPKASRGPDDMKKVPTDPPFTAFIGNLAYEATEEKIKAFFGKLPVVSVRLIEDGGRLRGFGYVELETRQALIDALAMNEEMLLGRKLRVDLAEESQHGEKGGRDGGRGRGGGRDEGGPDRTEGNWRSEGAEPESLLVKEYDSKDSAILKLFFDKEVIEIGLVAPVTLEPPQGPGLKLLIKCKESRKERIDPLIKDLDTKLGTIEGREVTVPNDAFAKLAEHMRSEEKRMIDSQQKERVLYRADIVKKLVNVYFWPGNEKAVLKLKRVLGIIETGGTRNRSAPTDQAVASMQSTFSVYDSSTFEGSIRRDLPNQAKQDDDYDKHMDWKDGVRRCSREQCKQIVLNALGLKTWEDVEDSYDQADNMLQYTGDVSTSEGRIQFLVRALELAKMGKTTWSVNITVKRNGVSVPVDKQLKDKHSSAILKEMKKKSY